MQSESPDVTLAKSATGGLFKFVPPLIFILLVAVTVVVWTRLLQHRKSLISRKSAFLCLQAGRRIEILVESRLRVVEVFARRWATEVSHSLSASPTLRARDPADAEFSRKRFEELADLLTRDLAGYRALLLLRKEHTAWVVPPEAKSSWLALPPAVRQALLARARDRALLSPPITVATGLPRTTAVFAVLRLSETEARQLVVKLDATELIGAGFHRLLRSEFHLRVADGDAELFRFDDDNGPPSLQRAPGGAIHHFTLRGRRWSVTLAPRDIEQIPGWSQEVPVLALGLLLSIGVAGLVHLLGRRVSMYRAARDHALSEVASRVRAEATLRRSEQRYRSVFDGATDGLLVVDADGMIVDANHAAATMHGFDTPDEMTGRPIAERIAPERRGAFDALTRRGATSAFRLDSINLQRDGSTVDVEVRGTWLARPSEEIGLLLILTDVTHRRQALERQSMLSRKALLAQEEERARVSRDLHDELGQILTALHLEIQLLAKRATVGKATPEHFVEAARMVSKAADELRSICKGLRPPLLDDLGLEPAIRLLVDEFGERTSIGKRLEVEIDSPVAQEFALCCYRVLQEALNNVRRHSGASEVSVSLSASRDALRLSVYDNGAGFDVDAAEIAGGCGIAGMRERASLVGAELSIRSIPGEGTHVLLRRRKGGRTDDEGTDRR